VTDERAAKYAEALRHSPNGKWLSLPGPVDIAHSFTPAILVVADAELAEKDATIAALRAEIERLTQPHATGISSNGPLHGYTEVTDD
jgi:hypothetical protein